MKPTDLVILSNGPGEVATWVRPVVRALGNRQQVRISVLLSPCPHSTGKEAAIAANYKGVESGVASLRVLHFLILGKNQRRLAVASTGHGGISGRRSVLHPSN